MPTEISADLISQWIGQHFWPFFRLASFMMVIPFIGTQLVPARVRLGLALLITVLVIAFERRAAVWEHRSQAREQEVRYLSELALRVIEQTERRVIQGERVPSSDKLVSLFEPHTDIIVKGFRDVQYGHKINLSSEVSGFITALTIEEGNPGDKTLFLPILDFHGAVLGKLPRSVVADGGYASQANVAAGRAMGLKHVVFHKPVGVSLTAMGVKSKTFNALRHFRAGVEGNISELKRAFTAAKAKWKGHDGFKAFVWASVLSYNLVRLARCGPT